MTKPNPLTRKAGPLPVWAWAALALVAGYVYLHRAPAASGGTQLPYTPASGSGAQQPASGQGTPADNGNSDLLNALGNNLASQDALLAALQSGGQGGGYGTTPSGGGTDTAATTAPTVVGSGAPADPAPADPTLTPTATAQSSPAAIAAAGDVPVTGALATNLGYTPTSGLIMDPTTGQVYGPSTAIDGGIRERVGKPYQADAVSRYLVNTIGYDPYVSAAPPVTQPTAYAVVQPAPVDTSGVITPTPAAVRGKAIAV